MRSRFFVGIIALSGLLIAGCGSPEERSAAYLTKAQTLYDAEDYTAARIEAMNAAQIEPRNADVRYLLAEIEEKGQDFRKAIGHLQVAVDADETHLRSRIKLGNYYVMAKAADEADAQATAAESLAPDNAEVYLLRARVYYLRDDNDAAMAEIEKALAKNPEMIDATMFKAGIYIARNDPDSALALVDDRLAAESGDHRKKLQQFRVIMLRAVNRNDEVEADLKAMVEEYPDDQTIAITLAQ
ncbi:MAG: tetratricopeptide repeat protein, partial [Gammaproteobacteria bacterium]